MTVFMGVIEENFSSAGLENAEEISVVIIYGQKALEVVAWLFGDRHLVGIPA